MKYITMRLFFLRVHKGHHYVSGSAEQGESLVIVGQSSWVDDAPSARAIQDTAVVS